MSSTLWGGSGPGLFELAGADAVGGCCKAYGGLARSVIVLPRMSNQGARQKHGHNGSGTEANMPVQAPERAWAVLASPTLMRPIEGANLPIPTHNRRS